VVGPDPRLPLPIEASLPQMKGNPAFFGNLIKLAKELLGDRSGTMAGLIRRPPCSCA
jgi:hypothetical protein